MSKVTFAFTSGKYLTCNTRAESIVDFFELNESDNGRMTGWLLFEDGHAVKVDNVDWIMVEESD